MDASPNIKQIEAADLPAATRWFDVVAVAFVCLLLVSNVAAQKLIAIGPFTFTAGVVIFPISYIFGDVLTEVYGYARARRIIWSGLLANVFMAAVIALVIRLPPAPGWPLQREFAATLGNVPRIVLASIAGYLVGELMNSFVLAKIKVLTGGRKLWLRTISSTIVGEGVDTALFVTVAFVGVFPGELLVKTAVSGWLFKVAYEIAATPLTYGVVNYLKRQEGFDPFDRKTNFSPFRFGA
jgi:uncharacterized integral membrane protein (TIGR00697 family)